MLPIRNISYLLPTCCSVWEKCKNSPKTGLGCSTPLRYWSRFLQSTRGKRPNQQARLHACCPMIHQSHLNLFLPHWQGQHQGKFMVGEYWDFKKRTQSAPAKMQQFWVKLTSRSDFWFYKFILGNSFVNTYTFRNLTTKRLATNYMVSGFRSANHPGYYRPISNTWYPLWGLLFKFQHLRGYCIPELKLQCFVHFLKISGLHGLPTMYGCRCVMI